MVYISNVLGEERRIMTQLDKVAHYHITNITEPFTALSVFEELVNRDDFKSYPDKERLLSVIHRRIKVLCYRQDLVQEEDGEAIHYPSTSVKLIYKKYYIKKNMIEFSKKWSKLVDPKDFEKFVVDNYRTFYGLSSPDIRLIREEIVTCINKIYAMTNIDPDEPIRVLLLLSYVGNYEKSTNMIHAMIQEYVASKNLDLDLSIVDYDHDNVMRIIRDLRLSIGSRNITKIQKHASELSWVTYDN